MPHADFNSVRSIKTGDYISRSEAIVITHGVFDLFHIGHLKLLERARALGGRLIVGVAGDEHIAHAKKRKPIINQDQRLEIIRSLKCVDEAYIFDSRQEMLDIIKKCNADVVVKGSDWEGKFEEQVRCPVFYLPYTEGISTTQLLETIRETAESPYLVIKEKRELALTLYQLMYDFDFYCQLFKVPYFATGGTLLGAIRHGGLMQWDDDLDVIVLKDQLEGLDNVFTIMEQLGYVVEDRRTVKAWKWDGFKVKAIQASGKSYDLDIFIRHKLPGDSYKSCSSNVCGSYLLKKKDIFPLRRVKFGGFFINVINSFQYQLDEKFGKEWSSIVSKYNHSENLPKSMGLLQQKDFLPLGPFGPLKERDINVKAFPEKSYYIEIEKNIRNNN